MEDFIHIDKTFEKVIYFDKKVSNREFDGCVFKNCDFSNNNFTECVFIDCEFIDCNLAMVKLPATSLKTVSFKECKLLGIRFDECADFLFNVRFENCMLDYSWFTNKKLAKTQWLSCSLKEVNFGSADLTSANFDNSNLEGAVFNETNVSAADFTTAFHFRIDPERNIIKKAKFSIGGIPGLLEKYDIKIV